MDSLTIAGIVVFLGCALALFLTRKISTTTGRFVLAALMLMTLGATIFRYEKEQAKTEAVWLDKAIKWHQTPLYVYWDEKAFSAHHESFFSAMSTWNRRVGCEIFRKAPGRVGAHVVFEPYDGTECGRDIISAYQIPENPRAAMSQFFCGTYTDVQVKRIDTVGTAFRMILHELGHAIGLDHDAIGAMAKTAVEPEAGDYPEFLLPSDKDVKAINERYCQ